MSSPLHVRRLVTAASAILLVALTAAGGAAHAVGPSQERGLLITPVRQYTSLNAGAQKTTSFTVANLTGKPITIKLAVKQFSVTDYVYDYRFEDPDNNWVKLSVPQVFVKSGESRKVAYTISVPAKSAPGGHYYTLFASTDLSDAGLQGTLRAASLLYVTVNGKLVQTSRLQRASIQRVVFGRQIPYTVDILNTGNVHYFAYVSGRLHGPTAKPSDEATHLLLPKKVRRASGTIPAPVLPGVYKATYGYRTDAEAATHQASALVLYVPPWSMAAALLLLLAGLKMYQRTARPRAGRRRNKPDER